MSGVASGSIFIDGFRDRESVAGSIAGALRDLEASATKKGERVIWSSVSFSSDTNYIDEVAFSGTTRLVSRTLHIGARTIDPAEVAL